MSGEETGHVLAVVAIIGGVGVVLVGVWVVLLYLWTLWLRFLLFIATSLLEFTLDLIKEFFKLLRWMGRSVRRHCQPLLVGVLPVVILGSSFIYFSHRNDPNNLSAVAQATKQAEPTEIPKPTETPDVQATKRAKPTATAPVLSDSFPTATADDPGTTTERREEHCPGYSAWIGGANDRTYRASVLVDLLGNTLDDDFEGIDFRAMKREIRFLIAAERDSLPPDELESYREDSVTLLKTIQDMVNAAEDKDWDAYNRAVEDYNAMLDGKNAEADDILSEKCG